MSTPVVKLDRELAIHHADFVDDEVSTIGPSELFFRLILCVVSTLSAGMCKALCNVDPSLRTKL